jgi:hypothetical protein
MPPAGNSKALCAMFFRAYPGLPAGRVWPVLAEPAFSLFLKLGIAGL